MSQSKITSSKKSDPLGILQKVVESQNKSGTLQPTKRHDELLIQDFVPVSESLDWQLSNWHWQNDGVASFVDGGVPYIINNSGRLSLQAAKLLYAHCELVNENQDNIILMEPGAGTGLFARYLLDHMKRFCQQQGTDYYQRLTYYVTDFAKSSLDDWQKLGIFDEHQQQVVLATCDANKPLQLTLLSGEEILLDKLNFVFCNYMLGVLDATMLKRVDEEWHELLISSHIDLANCRNEGPNSKNKFDLKEIEISLKSGQALDIEQLLTVNEWLDFTTRYQPLRESLAHYLESLPEGTEEDDRFLLNYGAIESMESILPVLLPHGGIIVSDYGPTVAEHIQDFAAFSRFGETTATGLNFLHLKPYFEFSGFVFEVPQNTEKAAVQSRMLGHPECKELIAQFQSSFGEESELYYQQPIDDARYHLRTDNKAAVLQSYQTALSLNPHDWTILTEIADFLIMQLEDFDAGISLAKDALAINPWYSTWGWNVLGDGYYCQGNLEYAHAAYLNALNISPTDPRTNLNLAYTHLRRQEHQEALNAIAIGLANDKDSEFRIKLLEKQQQILSSISEQYQANREKMDARNRKLCD